MATAKNRDKHPSYSRAVVSAASMRAPMRGEIMPLIVTTSSKRFRVPDDWKGSFVRFHADGGDLFVQVSTGDDASVNANARASEEPSGGVITATAPVDGAYRIPRDQALDVPFPVDAQTFALRGSDACCARTHPAES